MKPAELNFDFVNKIPMFDGQSSAFDPSCQKSSSRFDNFSLSILDPNKSEKRFTFSPVCERDVCFDLPFEATPFEHITKSDNEFFSFKKEEKEMKEEEPVISFVLKDGREGRLNDICEFLARAFNGENISLTSFDFKETDKELIHCIIRKFLEKILIELNKKKREKYKKKASHLKTLLTTKNYDALVKELFRTDITVIKRKEEKLKFVMKNTVSYFRKQYFRNQGLKSSKESELSFLNFYFKEHIEKYNLSVECFSDPLNKNQILNPKFNSLSTNYFKHLFTVESLKGAFYHHLEGRFKQSYQKKTLKKFRKMFEELYIDFESGGERSFDELVKAYIARQEAKKAIKLPWSNGEIDNAIKVFRTTIDKVLK